MRLLISRFLLLMMTGVSVNAYSTMSAASTKETPSSAIPVVASSTARNTGSASVDAEGEGTSRNRKLNFVCTSGTKVMGLVDRWSPLSTCPAGYQVTGLGRIDLQGDHNRPNLHVNDFICDDRGCKAWCIGDGCTVEARCCRITD